MKPYRRARFRYLLAGLNGDALGAFERSLQARQHTWRRRFFLGLSWLTTISAGFLLSAFQPYQPSDILIAIAGGYTLTVNILFIVRIFRFASFTLSA